jgi:hypothetical protein
VINFALTVARAVPTGLHLDRFGKHEYLRRCTGVSRACRRSRAKPVCGVKKPRPKAAGRETSHRSICRASVTSTSQFPRKTVSRLSPGVLTRVLSAQLMPYVPAATDSPRGSAHARVPQF